MRYLFKAWLLLLAVTAESKRSPPITADIQASWKEAPLLVQILESISLEVPSALFDLFSSLSTSFDPSNTINQVYDIALEITSESELLQGVGQIPALELSLATREASPKIQAFYEHYKSLNISTCDCWAKVPGYEQPICEPDLLKSVLEDSIDETSGEIQLLSFDHILDKRDKKTSAKTVILYADPLGTECFQLHNHLREAAEEGKIRYVFRWKPSASFESDAKPLILNGYGAYLDVKKSDYLVVDDRQVDSTRSGDSKTEESESGSSEDDGVDELEALSRTEILGLGQKAAQHILTSSDPLKTLVNLAQDFPKLAPRLALHWVKHPNESILKELDTIQSTKIDGGQSIIWMNGLQLGETELDTFSLQRILRQERNRIQSLVDLNLTQKQAVDILSNPEISLKQSSGSQQHNGRVTADALGTLFDASDRQEGGNVIQWWNNIEKDNRYKDWSPSLQELLKPMYPGSLPSVRRNLFNIVLVLDLKYTQSYVTIAESILPLVQRAMPFRMGLISLVQADDNLSLLAARLLNFVFQSFGKRASMEFVLVLSEATTKRVDRSLLESAYNTMLEKFAVSDGDSLPPSFSDATFVGGDESSTSGAIARKLQQSQDYCKRLDLTPSETGYAFINGKFASLQKSFQKQLQAAFTLQMQFVQHSVYFGDLKEEADAASFFYDLPSTYKKRSTLIFGDEGAVPRFAQWTSSVSALECLPSQNKNSSTIVHVVSEIYTEIAEAAQTFATETEDTIVCITNTWPEDSADLKVTANASYVIVNSRILGPFQSDAFRSDDFHTLIAFESKQRSSAFLDAFKVAEVDLESLAQTQRLNLIAGVTSIVSQSYLKDPTAGIFDTTVIRRSHGYRQIGANLTTLTFGDKDAYARFVVLIDPLSAFAQRKSQMLQGLSQIPGVSLQIFINPVKNLRELPLKRFYRHTFQPRMRFTPGGQEERTLVTFKGMPRHTLLTLGLEVHPSWLAFPLRSIHDLDNIRLGDLSAKQSIEGVTATFALENLIIEGHCRESKTGAPPRGLQLVLSSHSANAKDVDSLVMANLGYTQLKANPGSYNLSIRPGRSSEVFRMKSAGTFGLLETSEQVTDNTIDVTTFEGITVYPRFARNSGMELIDLLDEDTPKTTSQYQTVKIVNQVVSKWKSVFGKTSEDSAAVKVKTKDTAEINIFTVASGLLYERMAFLMILSVLRHTESSCRFWFISNFLSPAFKSFIPHMAAHYGFQYELITYKWPHWLRAQTEKQRTIWGYKILFLDVLFPLELDRVIFVDSDQIVRTDLKQLVDMDLKGAPYAYTPMGDDRKEMDGFRFWKSGYWAEHLRGLPYHISALYVIDLDRFRQMAAGDILRGQYQALSSDPNSLANLDQDLPNNMQHQIPIHTLDRSWLWCETWCSDESLADAKTIDLCNNPMTHEPKLARAKRLIPEWSVYDAEIAELARNISKAQIVDAAAFADEAAELGQAKLQQTEYVQEGTGGQAAEVDGNQKAPIDSQKHTKDEL